MSKIIECKEFLEKYKMNHDTINMEVELEKYISEMEKGLATKSGSSLMMLPTYLTVKSAVPYGEPIVVMDAGGTNFRVAVVTFFSDKAPLIEDFKMYSMPGTQGTIEKGEFFDTIAERLLPVVERSQRVGFCFSYPVEVLPNKDGKHISFSKEVSVNDMEGAVLGANINKSLAKHGVAPREFLILNDTVAAMLGGIVGDTVGGADSYIGFILGTGTNTCYAEECKNITKDPAACAVAGEMAVNMESGGYALIPRGEIDEDFDDTTKNPGQYKFEKMVSGAYQGGVLYFTVSKAIEEGLLSNDFAKSFFAAYEAKSIPLWDVDKFLDATKGDNPLAQICSTEDDIAVIEYIFATSYERAAKMTCISLGAIMKKTGKGKSQQHPVCVAAEGTTFNKSRVYREKLDIHVKEFLNDKLGIYCRFLKVEDATLLGTAVAGLIG